MQERLPDLGEEDGLSIVFRDVLILLALSYMVAALLIVPLIKVSSDTDSRRKANAVGAISVELTWTRADGADSESDVDLWVMSPKDSAPVGYRNKVGENFSLLRDDLGRSKTLGTVRFEFAASIEAPPGEYVVNAFLYRFADGGGGPLRYQLRVIKREEGGRASELYQGAGEIAPEDKEITLVRFVLDRNVQIVPGSTSRLYKRLLAP